MLDDILLGNYKTVATQLGLVISGSIGEGNHCIYGSVDGVPMKMWFGMHATHTGASFPRPLSLSLSIVTTSLMGKLVGLFSDDHGAIGDPLFDKTFSVKCEDVAQLSRMLDAEARLCLLRLADEGLHPAVDQDGVHLRRFSNGGMDSPSVIDRDFHATAEVAKTLINSFSRT